ncbi:MAG: hypothetical protein WCV67_06420 [Victivallaceae bacterium]
MKILQRLSTLALLAYLFSSISNLSAQDLPQATNITANPGFEEGVKSWTMSPASTICDDVFHEGHYSALIKCKGEGKTLLHISQILPLPPSGSKIDCSVWVRTSKPEIEYQVYCDITAQKEGGAPVWFAGPSSGVRKNPDSEWKEVRLSFTFPIEQTDKDGGIKKMCGFYFRLATRDKYAGDIWFDDVSVVVAPPSSK